MWELTQEAVDQRWEALIRPLARRRRFRRVAGGGLTCLFVIAFVGVTWVVGQHVLSNVMHVPWLGLRP